MQLFLFLLSYHMQLALNRFIKMKDDPREYEPHVQTANFLDYRGEYTPHPADSLQLPEDRQRVVDTVIAMYNGKISEHLEDFEACYAKESIYDDIMSFADTRCV